MTIVKIFGGLGNQMFQYALGRNISIKCNIEVQFDVFNYANDDFKRNYKLNKFSIIENIASKEEIRKLRGYEGIFRKILNKFKLDIIRPSSYYREKFYMKYNEGVFGDNLYLDGYWQNERYFKDIRNILLKEFLPKNISQKAKDYLKLIKNTNSVSIHIRRGDYLKLKHIYYICNLNYYKKAIDIIKSEVDNPKFFVFSDDIKWCKENLENDFIFIENTSDVDDMFLMKNCKHNIIANSTFSWWAAWLNENKNKIVIAPKKWFVEKSLSDINLSCENWRKI